MFSRHMGNSTNAINFDPPVNKFSLIDKIFII